MIDDMLVGLRAAGEPTRLRILAVLARCELTVGELCRVLGQTQPRVSRHLKLMCEAGLLSRHAQGTSAFYRPARSGEGRKLLDAVLPLIDPNDPALEGDLRRLADIRADRASAAASYFEAIATDWDDVRKLHVADDEVEAAMLSAVRDLEVAELLDVGTGTGRVLEIFADRIDHGIGVDLSQHMLDLARSRLDQLGLHNCVVRQGNAYDIGLPAGSVDVAVLHHVLHFLDDPMASISEATRTIRPGGRLLIVDFATHRNEEMRAKYKHYWLGFTDDEVSSWCVDAGLTDINATHLSLNDPISDGVLTVTLWVATQNENAPALYSLEAAS